jgi:hypothetical protein
MRSPVSSPAPHEPRPAEQIDLVADLNAQDDDGYGWSILSHARDQSAVKVGAMLLAGNAQAVAVVRVLAVDDDGQVHFTILPASLDKNRHLLDHVSAQEFPRK